MKDYLKTLIGIVKKESIGAYSAAFAYYLSMTLFPIMIILYFMLGENAGSILHLMERSKGAIPPELVNQFEVFISHIAEAYSSKMLIFAVLTIFLSASAGCATLTNSIGKMQGATRFRDSSFVAGVIMALLLVLTVYLIIVVLLLGRTVMEYISSYIPLPFELPGGWSNYLMLFLLFSLLLAGLYWVCQPKDARYAIVGGALVGALYFTINSALFSTLVAGSAKYQLLYGSSAGIILMLYYLYTCGMAIYFGAAVNIAWRDYHAKGSLGEESAEKELPSEEPVYHENPQETAESK